MNTPLSNNANAPNDANLRHHDGFTINLRRQQQPNYDNVVDKTDDANNKGILRNKKKKRSTMPNKRRVNTQSNPSRPTTLVKTPTRQELARRQRTYRQEMKTLEVAASRLESQLHRIQADHKATLLQIEEEKQREIAKIHTEMMVDKAMCKRKVNKEEASSNQNMEVTKETIKTLRDNNAVLRRENDDLADEIAELREENKSLFEETEAFYKAINSVKEEMSVAEERHSQLVASDTFLKNRQREYERARNEADQDIEYEKKHARRFRLQVEIAAAEIDKRCPDRDVADAIAAHVETTLSGMDEESPTLRTITCV